MKTEQARRGAGSGRAALLAFAAIACSRPSEPEVRSKRSLADSPSDAPAASAPLARADVPAPASTPPAAVSIGIGESRRASRAKLTEDPALRPVLKPLRDHFGPAPGPFDVQRAELGGARVALLVSRPEDVQPIVLVLDRDELLWTKQRPVAGISPPARHLALTPRPDGGVVLFVYVAAMQVLAARMWADDGNPYAEIDLAAVDACDALSAAYGGRFGWIVICSSGAGNRAQRLREDGTVAWARAGEEVGAVGPTGPASVVFDTADTWMLLQRARGAGADHALVWRYDGQGRALWPVAVDLGPLPAARGTLAEERLDAVAVVGRGARLTLPHGLAGRAARGVAISSEGTVRLLPE